jgi:tRNA (guanine37-N1)-methyltransferase
VPLRVDVVTTFPDYLAPLSLSLVGRARRTGRLDLRVHDLRAWATDRHRTTDDAPYGGGPGMVMRPDVWGRALDDVLATGDPDGATPVVLVPTPSGRRFDQAWAQELSTLPWLVVACGRYEGIDARVVEDASRRLPVAELSLGDVVLNGGEVVALAVVEAVVRLLPGVLGNPESLAEESHADGLLEYPVYTRPASWRGLDVPDVLQSGHHERIARWRRDESLRRTAARRPDLLRALPPERLDGADRAVLAALGWQPGPDGRFGPPTDALAD